MASESSGLIFPLLEKEGGCAERSEGAAGVVKSAKRCREVASPCRAHAPRRHPSFAGRGNVGTPIKRSYHTCMKPDAAIEIVRELRKRGYDAYLVGGCVRDMVMKIEPADYDIATSAKPEEIVTIFPRTESIGAQFGVILP